MGSDSQVVPQAAPNGVQDRPRRLSLSRKSAPVGRTGQADGGRADAHQSQYAGMGISPMMTTMVGDAA